MVLEKQALVSTFTDWVYGLVWDQLAFNGHWLLPLLLVLTIAGFWLWGRALVGSRTWLAWLGYAVLTTCVLLEISGVRMVTEPSFEHYARALRQAHSYIDKSLPELEFFRVDNNEPIRLTDLHGRTVLLNLWATWCPPCVHEMPDLEQLQQTHGELGLLVVTLSDESRPHLIEFLEEHPVETLNVYQESLDWIYDTNARPMNFLISPEGVLLDCTEMPGDGTYEAFAEWVDEHLRT